MTNLVPVGHSVRPPAPAVRPVRPTPAAGAETAAPSVPRSAPEPPPYRNVTPPPATDWRERQALARYREIATLPDPDQGEWLGRLDVRV